MMFHGTCILPLLRGGILKPFSEFFLRILGYTVDCVSFFFVTADFVGVASCRDRRVL